MYHLQSVSSAMLISFLIGLLFAAMCAIVGRQKGIPLHCVSCWAFLAGSFACLF